MVSVIIPCYNCEGFISRAINSVLNQTYKNFEIILVNNNSSDNTMQVLADLKAKYPDKISIYEEFKPGAPAARNCGLKNAKGKWIQFLDADDEILPNKLLQQIHLANCTGASVVAGNSLLEYTIKGKIKKVVRRTNRNIWKGLITSNLGITSSNLWQKDLLLDVNGWDENVTSSQEYDLLFRLLKKEARIVTDKSVDTIVHFSENSVSKSTDVNKLKKILNNRVTLRLKIKEELERTNSLTKNLSLLIDDYIYTEIMSFYRHFPQYARELLKEHNPKIKLSKALKLKTKNFLKSLLSKK
ncbi:glycosyltransferase [Pedobacter sp. HMF7647]|uniref:Glycosyltransferase n=1 Tax=Hufsiella arboris TaxID=2695275 RepID=A0A7K1Y9R5_9SPHI|nr:glycosyltransferase family 2 protein [Hufsiella arboris]MXV51314.1 glycosyltransferase [Hufsiella arboris]